MNLTPANTAQIDYWNAHVGRTWAEHHEALDRQIQPLGDVALEALAPVSGERILDIGCGCGETTLALGQSVGPDGMVEGIDVSGPMLEIARRRPTLPKSGTVTFRQADAQTEQFALGGYDAFYSRFGVMFFEDPVAAFANLRLAIKPGGRFAFVCWRALEDNPWMVEPLAAAQPYLPPRVLGDPMGPGPFAFANPERLTAILTQAGWDSMRLTRFDTRIGAGDVDAALDLALRVGPLGSGLRESPHLVPIVAPLVREVLSRYLTPDGVRMPASVWIVQGQNPL
jgi:SAM-dependent methyltransferase